jgi:peptidoglycan/xylan/chitin deacetylase (PgdA/CDA1 family)
MDLRATLAESVHGGARVASYASTAPWLRVPLRLLSPGGARGRLSILIFHRVLAAPDPLFPAELDLRSFEERMRWIRSWFSVLPLDDAVVALARGTLPDRALAITFDDGYADNVTVALPILQRLGLHATFFIASGYLDGGTMWNDRVIEAVRNCEKAEVDASALGLGVHPLSTLQARRAAIAAILRQLKYRALEERRATADDFVALCGSPRNASPMMTSAQLRELSGAGMGIGAHTATHPILARMDTLEARREIADGRDALEGIVRQPVRLFAYPNGKPDIDYGVAHVDIVRALGFAAAASTARGAACSVDSVFELPRFTPWDASPLRYAARMASNMLADIRRATA